MSLIIYHALEREMMRRNTIIFHARRDEHNGTAAARTTMAMDGTALPLFGVAVDAMGRSAVSMVGWLNGGACGWGGLV